MPRKIESLLLDGPAGRLEALLEEPDDEAPREAVLVCHPHPLHGGTLHNKVVYRIARGFRHAGAVVLRFNFRGVNLSTGTHDGGQGEIEDARAALRFLRERYAQLPFSIAGFSFGSRVGLRLGCSLEGPAPRLLMAVGFPTVYREYEFLMACNIPRVFIQSTHDEFGPKEELERLAEGLPEPKKVVWVEAKDHFFAGALDEFERAVLAAAREAF
jgi:uncharacterized protein